MTTPARRQPKHRPGKHAGGRPPKAVALVTVPVRLHPDQVDWLDRRAAELEATTPGLSVTRGGALRNLVARAMAGDLRAPETPPVPAPATPPAPKPTTAPVLPVTKHRPPPTPVGPLRRMVREDPAEGGFLAVLDCGHSVFCLPGPPREQRHCAQCATAPVSTPPAGPTMDPAAARFWAGKERQAAAFESAGFKPDGDKRWERSDGTRKATVWHAGQGAYPWRWFVCPADQRHSNDDDPRGKAGTPENAIKAAVGALTTAEETKP